LRLNFLQETGFPPGGNNGGYRSTNESYGRACSDALGNKKCAALSARQSLIASSIERFYQILQEILKMESPLIFAESEKKAMLRGKVLNQKEQETIHITFLLDILIRLGIKDISFDKGLEKDELSVFIKLLAKKPETIFNEGGLPKLMAENRIAHIYMDKKVYVAMDKDNEAISNKPAESNTSSADKSNNVDIISRLMDDLLNEKCRHAYTFIQRVGRNY